MPADPALGPYREGVRRAALQVREHPDLRPVQWAKLLLNPNNAINAPCPGCRCAPSCPTDGTGAAWLWRWTRRFGSAATVRRFRDCYSGRGCDDESRIWVGSRGVPEGRRAAIVRCVRDCCSGR
ncbi:hypothetical protein GCM10028864_32750 [Microlunatus parietis]